MSLGISREEQQPFGNRLGDLNRAAETLRAKIHRAAKRGSGTHLTAAEVAALDFMEADGEWWNAPREAIP